MRVVTRFAVMLTALVACTQSSAQPPNLSPELTAYPILYVARYQYASDHHNTATLFQTGEINSKKFQGGECDSDDRFCRWREGEGSAGGT